mmetsp:Transcript_41935/g.30781  ORF Transcript_41935/g.30781 Transcript_41935/m.30781 type:complete len:133 (+) Transcript_41935:297-695(+)
MKSILNIKQTRFDLVLQQTYYNPHCHFYYMTMAAISVGLILLTIIFGFKVFEGAFFKIMEAFLNICIVADLLLRTRLQGCKVLYKGIRNKIDSFVAILSVLVFIMIIFTSASDAEIGEQLSEEFLLIFWTVF